MGPRPSYPICAAADVIYRTRRRGRAQLISPARLLVYIDSCVKSLTAKFRASPPAICAALLVLHALLLGWAALANSATFDEPAHLAAGVEYWRHGDFSIYSLSPPLLRLWAAVPPLLAGAKAPDTLSVQGMPVHDRHWSYADGFVYGNYQRFPFFLVIARWGMIPLSCLAGWIVYRWATDLYGAASGLAALTLYCLCPSILGHGSLVTTAIGTSAFIVLAAWLWWRYCRNPSLQRWALVVVALVAAHLCKFTALLLWPIMAAMAFPLALHPAARRWLLLFGWIGAGVFTLFLIDAIYGFQGVGQPLGAVHFYSDSVQNLQRLLPYHFPSPLPTRLIVGIDAQKFDTQARYTGFLFGVNYPSTVWCFYPVALLCKLPVSMIILAGWTLFSFIKRSGRKWASDPAAESSLLEAGLVFFCGVVLLSDLNIGTRYLLPAFPLCIILMSRLWSTAASLQFPVGGKLRLARTGLIVLLAMETLWVAPRFLSFINFAFGGPSNGWWLLTDSDFDWGQSLVDLQVWMKDHSVPCVTLAYFGLVDPRIYGVDFTPITLPSSDPYVAISSYYLDGKKNRMVVGPLRRIYPDVYYHQALQGEKPVAVVGNTIFIYHRQDVMDAIATYVRSSTQPSTNPAPQ